MTGGVRLVGSCRYATLLCSSCRVRRRLPFKTFIYSEHPDYPLSSFLPRHMTMSVLFNSCIAAHIARRKGPSLSTISTSARAGGKTDSNCPLPDSRSR